MKRASIVVSLLATFAATATLAAGCIQPPDSSGDEEMAASKPGDEEEGAVGTAEQALIACPLQQMPFRKGVDYKYTWNYKTFAFKISYDDTNKKISYSNAATDGSFSAVGVVNHWNRCPAGNENVNLTRSDGVMQTCTHVCLPDGREELHCPTSQLVMTVTAQHDVCVPLPKPLDQKGQENRARPCGMPAGSVRDACRGTFKSAGCEDTCEICWTNNCDPDMADNPSDAGFWACVGTRDPDNIVNNDGSVSDGWMWPGICSTFGGMYETTDPNGCGAAYPSWCDAYAF